MAEADKLREMINNADDDADDIQDSIDQVEEQIAEWQEKQDALEHTLDSCCYDSTTGLVPVLLPTKGTSVVTYNNFSISNAEDWLVGDIELDNDDIAKDDITVLGGNTFECDNDHSTEFAIGQIIGFHFIAGEESGGKSAVQTVDYNVTTSGKTTVILEDSVLDSTSVSAIIPTYVYEGIGWDSDSEIQDRIDEFDFAYDYIMKPMDATGTYGTQANIANLNIAKQLLTANKNKVEDSKTALEKFAS